MCESARRYICDVQSDIQGVPSSRAFIRIAGTTAPSRTEGVAREARVGSTPPGKKKLIKENATFEMPGTSAALAERRAIYNYLG